MKRYGCVLIYIQLVVSLDYIIFLGRRREINCSSQQLNTRREETIF